MRRFSHRKKGWRKIPSKLAAPVLCMERPLSKIRIRPTPPDSPERVSPFSILTFEVKSLWQTRLCFPTHEGQALGLTFRESALSFLFYGEYAKIITSQHKGGTRPPSPREVDSRGSSPAAGRFATPDTLPCFPQIIKMMLK